jgi:tripartite-type tricarboxylate transporter receptor subunit TctC
MQNKISRRAAISAICTLATSASSGISAATGNQSWPARPVRFVVPYAAGGTVDVLMRAVARSLQDEWSQSLIVENKPGANEILAALSVAKAPNDGYTLLAATEASLTMNEFLYEKLGYSPTEDFVSISRLVEIPLILVVPATLPVSNLKDFVELARRSAAAPLAYASAGAGGVSHLPMVTLEINEGIKLNHAPYKGVAPIVSDLMSNIVQASLIAAPIIEQQVKLGNLRALAVSSSQRLSVLPNVPTFTEAGFKDIGGRFSIGLVAPAKTSNDIVQKVSIAMHRIVTASDFRQKYLDPFGYVAVGSNPADFEKFLQADRVAQEKRIKASGITVK